METGAVFGREDKRTTPQKPKTHSYFCDARLAYSPQRTKTDQADRARILTRLKQKLEHPSKLKAALRKGGNQYLDMTLKPEELTLDEAKIREAKRFDGYYTIITNNLTLTTAEVCDIYRGLWRIEERLRMLKSDLRVRPDFVWRDAHIQGHFLMCYVSLCLLRYRQYLLEKHHPIRCSAEKLMHAIKEPLALV
ncbi:MAG: hypothetical protein EA374_07700 [Acholeplasmatales bacterium]|nr:MAG: hypothetical protein EA374_07700 [Acholeplasmatales bacterium]